MLKINLACGDQKFDSWINIDINRFLEPDIVANITRLPFKDKSAEVVTLFHTIEHINEHDQPVVLKEIHRILDTNGILYVSYPEFRICAQNYINNYKGDYDFWKHTIFGRQADKFDYHVSLMDTKHFVQLLRECGFKNIRNKPESINSPYNTIVKAIKKSKPVPTNEDLIRNEVFTDGTAFRHTALSGCD